MGIYIHSYVSIYSFVMGILWFNAFIILGLIMRKLKFPIKFSVAPLLLLLILSVLRMFIAVEFPGTTIILSETIYPAIVNILRHEIVGYRVFGLPFNVTNVLILIWIVVTVYLIARYFSDYIGKFGSIMRWFERCERDKYAESLLAEMIGSDKHFHVYRNGCFSIAAATAVKPYIILPKVEFPPDELRAILLHEWKHIQDKDYLAGFIVDIICFVFWWNPLVYVLRRNFLFVQELKCDRFAVDKGKRFNHYLNAILLLYNARKEKEAIREKYMSNTLISDDDEIADRLKILALRGVSRNKRILANVCYSVVIFALFLVSYMFIVLPIFWISDVNILDEPFIEEYGDGGGIFRAGETFVVDNEDGTFSLYIDGQFIMNVCNTVENFDFLQIRK